MPATLPGLARLMLLQLALSTFWAIVALTTIVAGLSRRIELVHKAGAGLLTIAALKVLLVDTQQFGGPARVGAFIGVGPDHVARRLHLSARLGSRFCRGWPSRMTKRNPQPCLMAHAGTR